MFNLYPLTRDQTIKSYKMDNSNFMTKDEFKVYCEITKPNLNNITIKLEDLNIKNVEHINNNDPDKSI